MYGYSSMPWYSLTCKTLVLYHSGPLQYVYVCIQLRCFITEREEGGREGGREGGKEGGSNKLYMQCNQQSQ